MIRRLQHAALAVLTVAAVLMGSAVRADAATTWYFQDGFETSKSSWYRDCDGCYYRCPAYRTCDPAYVDEDADRAHNGTHYALIASTAGYPDNWVSLGRSVRLPAGATECSLTAYMRIEYAGYTPATVNIEAIRTSTWTYEALRSYQITDLGYYSAYRYIQSGTWTPGPRDVTVRIVAAGQHGVLEIHVDDITVKCKVG